MNHITFKYVTTFVKYLLFFVGIACLPWQVFAEESSQCSQYLSIKMNDRANYSLGNDVDDNVDEVSTILSQPSRPQGLKLELKSVIELLDLYSFASPNKNQIFLILAVKVSKPSAVRNFLGIIEKSTASRGIFYREDLTYFRFDSEAEEQNLEIPIGGSHDQIMDFLKDNLNAQTLGSGNVENISVEIIDLGGAQKERTSPILIGHGQVSIQGLIPRMTTEASMAFAKAEDLIAQERLSVPILQLGLSKELNGYSPFIVMVPAVEGILDAIQSTEKNIIGITKGFEELSEDWVKHFLKVAKGRSIYSVITESSHYYLMNGDNYSRVDAFLTDFVQQEQPSDEVSDFPVELLGMIKTCLGCEFNVVSDDSITPSKPVEIAKIEKGSRRLYPQDIDASTLKKIQSAAGKDGAKYALRDSFPREMNSMGSRLDEIILRMLERMGANQHEIASYFKELESWSVDYHLDIFQWGLNPNGKCRNNYTCYLLLKVIVSLGSIYNMKDIGPHVNITTLHTYEGMRSFLDTLGFPKIHDGQRVITSKVLNDLERLIDSQLALAPLIGQLGTQPTERSKDENVLVNNIFTDAQYGGARALMEQAKVFGLLEENGYPNTVTLISRMRINLNSYVLSKVLSMGGRTELTRERLRDLEISIRDLKIRSNDLELALNDKNADAIMRILGAMELLINLYNQNLNIKMDSTSVYHYHPLQRFLELTNKTLAVK